MMTLQEIFSNFIEGFKEMFTNLPAKIGELISNPMTIFTLLGLLAILFVLLKVKNIKLDSTMITRIGLALALATVLNLFKIYSWPTGGGITLASMLPLILIALIYGPWIGMLTGFLFGGLSLITDPYILHPVQVLFDYPLPYLCLGIAGFFKDKNLKLMLFGSGLAIFLRFLCHTISGVVFFAEFAPEGMSPLLYSLSVNGTLIGVDGIICLVALAFIPLKLFIKSNTKVVTN